MLFDPFEKQFDLPTTFVELRDHERRQHKVVRQKHKPFAGFDVEVMNSSQRLGIRLRRFDSRQHNRLVAAKTGRLVDDPRLPTLGIEVLFGACQEECGLLVQPVQTRIVDVRPVHDVERARFVGSSSRMFTSCIFPCETRRKRGILPRRSSNV